MAFQVTCNKYRTSNWRIFSFLSIYNVIDNTAGGTESSLTAALHQTCNTSDITHRIVFLPYRALLCTLFIQKIKVEFEFTGAFTFQISDYIENGTWHVSLSNLLSN